MGRKLGELAALLGAQLHGDPDCVVERVATLAGAGPGALSFLHNRRYCADLAGTHATAVLLESEFLDACPTHALVHPSAEVSALAEVHASAWVGPQCSIGEQVRIGANTVVGPGCVLESGVSLGPDSLLVANVTLCHDVSVGCRAVIHPGVVIGADGFGIANDDGVWIKVPQLGGVSIGDDVEIGANSTIDRGALEATVIEDGVKLDNLIQIGHNVHIGANTAVAACVAIGGSAKIGKRCTIAGAVSIAGHLEIADEVHLTATSAVPHSIPAAGVYSSGMPIQDNRSWRKNVVRMRQLDDMARRLRRLEARLKVFEENLGRNV